MYTFKKGKSSAFKNRHNQETYFLLVTAYNLNYLLPSSYKPEIKSESLSTNCSFYNVLLKNKRLPFK